MSAVNWIDFFVIPYPGGDERWHVHGGNDLVSTHPAATLPPDSKVLIQYDRRPWRMSDWSASLESVDPDFEPGRAPRRSPARPG